MKRKKFLRQFLMMFRPDGSRYFNNRKLWVTFCSPPSSVALLNQCPVPGWIAASSSVASVVTFSGALIQWDITQLGSTRRATAKARTQPLRIYHPNKRPLPRGATQEYIKLQHNSRSLLQVFHPPTLFLTGTKAWHFKILNMCGNVILHS